jgi:hypothetical protein
MQASARRNRQSRPSPSGVPDLQHLVVAQGWRGSQAVSGGLAGSSTIEAREAIRWQHLPEAEREGCSHTLEAIRLKAFHLLSGGFSMPSSSAACFGAQDSVSLAKRIHEYLGDRLIRFRQRRPISTKPYPVMGKLAFERFPTATPRARAILCHASARSLTSQFSGKPLCTLCPPSVGVFIGE